MAITINNLISGKFIYWSTKLNYKFNTYKIACKMFKSRNKATDVIRKILNEKQ